MSDVPTGPPSNLPPPPGRTDGPPTTTANAPAANAGVDLHSWLEVRRRRGSSPDEVAIELRSLGWTEPSISDAIAQYVPEADRQPLAWWSLYAGAGITALGTATFTHIAVDGLSSGSRNLAAVSATGVILAAPFAIWGYIATRRTMERSPAARYSSVRRTALDTLLWAVFVIAILRLLVYVFQLVGGLLDVDGVTGSSLTALGQALVTLAVAGPLWAWGWSERRNSR